MRVTGRYTGIMPRFSRLAISTLLSVAVAVMARGGAEEQAAAAEQRAVAYLSQEVPDWPRQNNCFSCHNNGDAARALYVARSMSHAVPAEALADTNTWLLQPLAWNEAKGDPGFSDLKLARIQFAAALTEAVQTGAIGGRDALATAANGLLEDQENDGSWDVDVPGVVGSPATYGDALGTYMARRTLEAASVARFGEAIARADAWFLTVKPVATVDVAAIALALADRLDKREQPPQGGTASAARAKFHETIERILGNPSSDGGWGPYPKSPSEPFDTAVALLALKAANDLGAADSKTIERAVAEGRAYLVRTQLPAGGWPETTRPSGFQSYAQHISTSGWATLALLKTKDIARR
jgi:hypothetical protein